MSPAAYLASPSESSDSASSEEPCPAPVDGHSWPLQSSSTDSDGLSQPLARYSRLSISHHALTHVLPNVPIRHYARGKHTRTQKSGSESSDCARRTARVIVAVAYVRSQTPCIAGSRRTASRQLPRWHRSLHPQYCLRVVRAHEITQYRTQETKNDQRHAGRGSYPPFIFVKSNHVT